MTVLLVPPGDVGRGASLAPSLRGRRVAAVYWCDDSPCRSTALEIAGGLGVQPRSVEVVTGRVVTGGRAAPAQDAVVQRFQELEGIADLHRGETVVLVAPWAAIVAGLPQLAVGAPRDAADPDGDPVAEVLGDADGWALVRWRQAPSEQR